MPISLEILSNKLRRRLNVLESALERHSSGPRLSKRVDCQAIQEGIISTLWQSWCWFAREVVIASAKGAVTSSGLVTTSIYALNAEPEIIYIAKQLAWQRPIGQIKPILRGFQEPTWGDLDKLNRIILGVNCTNSKQLASVFGSTKRIKDLQLCRNSSAHINKDNITALSSARVRYLNTKLNHPSDMIFWIDPDTNEYVWKSWIDELEIISLLAIL